MHALELVNVNVHIKFEVLSFTHYKDIIGAPKFITGHLIMPLLWVIYYPKARCVILPMRYKIKELQPFQRYDWGPKFKMCHVTPTTPISEVVCHPTYQI